MTGYGSGLAALAQNRQTVDRADWRAFAFDRQRFRNAQSRAIEHGQHGGVARQYPGLPGFPLAGFLVHQIASVGNGESLGQAMRTFGRPQSAEKVRFGETLFFGEAQKRSHRGQRAQQRSILQPFIAALGEKCPQVRRLQSPQFGGAGRLALVFGEKAQEKPQVATIGVERVPRRTPLTRELAKPADRLDPDLGAGAKRRRGRNLEQFCFAHERHHYAAA